MFRSAPILLAAGLGALAFQTAPASALNDRSFVSGLGDDGNACTRIAPCKTFQTAHDKTSAGGVINCADPAEYGPVFIKKSITIDCAAARGSITVPAFGNVPELGSGYGIIPQVGPAGIVTIVGVDIRGRIGDKHTFGILANFQVNELQLRNVSVSGVDYGIWYQPTNTGAPQLLVEDSVVANSARTGIIVQVSEDGFEQALNVHFNRVRVENSGLAIWTNSESSIGVNINMKDCMISGNSSGILAHGVNASTNISISGTQFSGNFGPAIATEGNRALVLVGASMITANIAGMSTANGGQILSFGNNQVNSNGGGETFTRTVGLK